MNQDMLNEDGDDLGGIWDQMLRQANPKNNPFNAISEAQMEEDRREGIRKEKQVKRMKREKALQYAKSARQKISTDTASEARFVEYFVKVLQHPISPTTRANSILTARGADPNSPHFCPIEIWRTIGAFLLPDEFSVRALSGVCTAFSSALADLWCALYNIHFPGDFKPLFPFKPRDNSPQSIIPSSASPLSDNLAFFFAMDTWRESYFERKQYQKKYYSPHHQKHHYALYHEEGSLDRARMWWCDCADCLEILSELKTGIIERETICLCLGDTLMKATDPVYLPPPTSSPPVLPSMSEWF